MKKSPVFEYVDFSPDRDSASKEEVLRMTHRVYIFCKLYKTNNLLFRNLATGHEQEMKINVKQVEKLLNKEGIIN